MMCDVVIRGPHQRPGAIPGHYLREAGITHRREHGFYNHKKFNSSFMSAAPAENPRLVAIMIVHEPDTSIAHYGGDVSRPGR